jgi:hypothetical protein
MVLLIIGVFLLAITAVVFWMCLPRNGVPHRLVGTAWEPYIAVAFCAAVALSVSMMLSGALALVGAQ